MKTRPTNVLLLFLALATPVSSDAQSSPPRLGRELERAQQLLLVRSCQFQSASAIGAPSLTVREVKPSAGVYQGMFKVRGSVEGVCLQEAGAWKDGRRSQLIRVATMRRFQRFPFEVRAKVGEELELRATNTAGETVRLKVPLPDAPASQTPAYFGDRSPDSPFERSVDSWDLK